MSLIWLCRRAKPSSQVARRLEILAEFSYWIEYRHAKKHGNVDKLNRRRADGCKQCLNIECRDGGPTRSDVEKQIGKAVYTAGRKGNFNLNPPLKLLTTFMQTLHCSGTSRSYVGSKLHYLG